MSYTYANRKRGESAAPKKEIAAPQPSMDALRAGFAKPTQEQMGRRVDLPDAMRAKMENAFGADLSAVKLYESEAVADAGANAVAQGSNIAFAPGMLDFTSYGGQALLGHEISHVVSQQRGEVTGNGFLNDHALEARADREGAMAAAGRQIAMPTAALSTATAASAAGPMQASKAEEKAEKHQNKQAEQILKMVEIEKAKNAHFNQKWNAEQGVDFSERDPIAIKYAKQKAKALKKAQKAFRWENYWNNKLDAQAEKAGEKSTANRGAVGMKLMDALAQRHRDESGKLDFVSYREDVNLATNFLHDADTSVMNWLDEDQIREGSGLDDGFADILAAGLANSRMESLSKRHMAELDELDKTPNGRRKAQEKVRERYNPIKRRLRRESPW